jgi:hypothetical protein
LRRSRVISRGGEEPAMAPTWLGLRLANPNPDPP